LGVPSAFTFVIVLSNVTVTLVPQQESRAVGVSKVHWLPQSTVLSGTHVNSGGVMSTIVTVWVQVAPLPQQSRASHFLVRICGQVPLVKVPITVIVTLLPQQPS